LLENKTKFIFKAF